MALMTVHQEEFPNIEVEVVSVQVPYLGARPIEAEQGVCMRIEEAVEGVEGIDRCMATASEGMCAVQIMLLDDADGTRALNEIKNLIDGISSVSAGDRNTDRVEDVVSPERARDRRIRRCRRAHLKELAREVRDEVAAIDGISQVDLVYVRPYELSDRGLRIHAAPLTASRSTSRASAVAALSLDMPGGTIAPPAARSCCAPRPGLPRAGVRSIVVMTRTTARRCASPTWPRWSTASRRATCRPASTASRQRSSKSSASAKKTSCRWPRTSARTSAEARARCPRASSSPSGDDSTGRARRTASTRCRTAFRVSCWCS